MHAFSADAAVRCSRHCSVDQGSDGPGSFLQHPRRGRGPVLNSHLLGQFEDTAWLGGRAAKVSAQTGNSEIHPNAVSLSETVDNSAFGVSDLEAEIQANRHLDPAKSEAAHSSPPRAGTCRRPAESRMDEILLREGLST